MLKELKLTGGSPRNGVLMLPVTWALCAWRRGARRTLLLPLMTTMALWGGGWLNAISLPFINAARFITAFFVLEKQFKVFGRCCPHLYLTGEWVNIRKHQGKGLGKYELQRQTHSPSNLVLFKPKCIKMKWTVSGCSEPCPSEPLPLPQCQQGCTQGLAAPHTQPLYVQSCLEMVWPMFYENKLGLEIAVGLMGVKQLHLNTSPLTE